MTQHRVYFTDIEHGYIICDSEDEAKEIQQALEDGEPIDELVHHNDLKLTGGSITATIKSLSDLPKVESSSY